MLAASAQSHTYLIPVHSVVLHFAECGYHSLTYINCTSAKPKSCHHNFLSNMNPADANKIFGLVLEY